MTYTPQLVSVSAMRKPLGQTWTGSLNIPIVGGTHGQKDNPTGISFSKTGSYGWAFWVKFDADDDVYRQIIMFGTLGTNGYRIVKDQVSTRNVICFQEASANYTADKWYYPQGFDITRWHHIAITWRGTSSTAVSTSCYINGIWTTSKSNSITWANAVATSTPLIVGYDWADHTIGGNINDIGFYNQVLTADNVYDIMHRRGFGGAVGWWKCEDGSGTTLTDSIAGNNLTLYNSAAFQEENQSW